MTTANDLYETTQSLQTQKAYAIAKLGADVNLLIQLLDRLKACNGLREPDKWGAQYAPNEHLRLIMTNKFSEAYQLITSRSLRPDQQPT